MRMVHCHSPTSKRGSVSLLLGGLIIDHLLFCQLFLANVVDAQQPLDAEYEVNLLRRLLILDRKAEGQFSDSFVQRQMKVQKQRHLQLAASPSFSSILTEGSRPWHTEEEKQQLFINSTPKRNIAIGRGDGFRPG